MSRQNLVMARSFYVAIKYFCGDSVWPWMGFLCHDFEFFLSRPSLVQGPREFMSRHSVLCRESGARHCVAVRLRANDKHALSQQCDAVLCRDKEGYACETDQARRARAQQARSDTHDKASASKLGAHTLNQCVKLHWLLFKYFYS